MDLFGFCPSREEFTLALCEICNMLVKPQALKRHIGKTHHGNQKYEPYLHVHYCNGVILFVT